MPLKNAIILFLICFSFSSLSFVNSSQQLSDDVTAGCIVSPFIHSNLFDEMPMLSSTSFNYDNKVLNCSNVSISKVNREYFNGITNSDIAYKQIILKNMINDVDGVGNFLYVINEQQTELLTLINSGLTNLQFRAIFREKNFTRLKYLNVAANQFDSIDSMTFQMIKRLRELNLARNNIRHLTDDVFRDLVELRILDLSGNNITELNQNTEIFNKLTELRVLDLSHNTINDIPRHIFYGLGNLVELNISNNQLSLLRYQIFESMRSVEIIDLSYNYLYSFLDNFFIHNSRLKILQLHHNKLSAITKNSLFGLKDLHTLNLSHNQISIVDRNAFDTLDGLQSLDLSNNHIRDLSGIVFLSLKQLQQLTLNNNPLHQLPLGIFANQFQLRALYMDNTKIQRLGNWIDSATNATINQHILQNLKHVSLRNSTNLMHVESCFFYNLPKIEHLYITDSKNVTFLPKGIEAMSHLVELDLSKNKLEYIPEGLKHLSNLKVLNLLNNEFLCDCHMFWMLGWIDELKIKNKTLPYDLLRLSELKCRDGYPGDIMRVLHHINCVKPHLIYATNDQQYEVFSDAILECRFAGTPAPQIVWRTPHGKLLRYIENYENDPNAKFQLNLQHRSVLEDTLNGIKFQPLMDSEARVDTLSERVRQGPGITLLENGFLKIHNISRLDSGLYTCFAVNIMGNASTDVR